jgi:hypothetical protein
MYKKAYENIVYACKDKIVDQNGWDKNPTSKIQEACWEANKMQEKSSWGSRCKRWCENMSIHGVIMHFSYCGEPSHNRGGCKWRKQDS